MNSQKRPSRAAASEGQAGLGGAFVAADRKGRGTRAGPFPGAAPRPPRRSSARHQRDCSRGSGRRRRPRPRPAHPLEPTTGARGQVDLRRASPAHHAPRPSRQRPAGCGSRPARRPPADRRCPPASPPGRRSAAPRGTGRWCRRSSRRGARWRAAQRRSRERPESCVAGRGLRRPPPPRPGSRRQHREHVTHFGPPPFQQRVEPEPARGRNRGRTRRRPSQARSRSTVSQEMGSSAAPWEAKQPHDMSRPRASATSSAARKSSHHAGDQTPRPHPDPSSSMHTCHQLHPRQDDRRQVDQPQRQDVIGRDVEGEGARVGDLVQAGADEQPPQVPAGRHREPGGEARAEVHRAPSPRSAPAPRRHEAHVVDAPTRDLPPQVLAAVGPAAVAVDHDLACPAGGDRPRQLLQGRFRQRVEPVVGHADRALRVPLAVLGRAAGVDQEAAGRAHRRVARTDRRGPGRPAQGTAPGSDRGWWRRRGCPPAAGRCRPAPPGGHRGDHRRLDQRPPQAHHARNGLQLEARRRSSSCRSSSMICSVSAPVLAAEPPVEGDVTRRLDTARGAHGSEAKLQRTASSTRHSS